LGGKDNVTINWSGIKIAALDMQKVHIYSLIFKISTDE